MTNDSRVLKYNPYFCKVPPRRPPNEKRRAELIKSIEEEKRRIGGRKASV